MRSESLVGEPFDEGERGFGDLAPAVVDREGVAETGRGNTPRKTPGRLRSRSERRRRPLRLMSYGQPCSRTAGGPSAGPLSTYPTFRGPASIWLTSPSTVLGSVVGHVRL